MDPVPCVLLTGFLGSGKTTFLNWLLKNHPNKKISVILNEFGDIKLESNFVRQHADDIVELANGCMCCVAKADLPRVINYILEHSPVTDYIIIEASGLSDPDPIHDSFSDPAISDRVFLNSIICLVDAVNFAKTRVEHKIITSQIADCDTIIISKTSLVSAAELTKLKNDLSALLPNTQILEFSQSLDPDLFLNSSPSPARPPTRPRSDPDHCHEEYQTWWYIPDQPLDPIKMRNLLTELPADVVRAKGFFRDPANDKFLLQVVGDSIQVIKSDWRPDETPKSALLFIGKKLDTGYLNQLLSQTVSV